jgi:hypothetical protein
MLKYSMEDLKTAQEKRKRAFKDLVEESSIFNVSIFLSNLTFKETRDEEDEKEE